MGYIKTMLTEVEGSPLVNTNSIGRRGKIRHEKCNLLKSARVCTIISLKQISLFDTALVMTNFQRKLFRKN